MEANTIENNQVHLIGKIAGKFIYSHNAAATRFYKTELVIERQSLFEDRIPLMVTDQLFDITQDHTGEYVEVYGQFKSGNRYEGEHRRLLLSVFASKINHVAEDVARPVNEVFLEGTICRSPIYRKTPLEREITDVLLTVKQSSRKSHYIPCICWGRNARYASAFNVGDTIKIWGRIQSRIYFKKKNDTEKRIAYEVSVSRFEL